MKKIFTLLLIISLALSMFSQENESAKANFFRKATSYQSIPSIESRKGTLELADLSFREIKDGRYRTNRGKIVIGKGLPKGDDPLINNSKNKRSTRSLDFTFDAVNVGGSPSDPSGAVGPNHYISIFNSGFRIFDKTGTPLTAPLNISTILPNDVCCDLTVSYDNAADRFVITALSTTSFGINPTDEVQFAISQGPNPVTDGWHVYSFPMVTDYQKVSIWSDGYYMTANKNSNSASTSQVVYALERDKMLNGDLTAQIIGFPLPGIRTFRFYSPQAFNVTNDNMPAVGNMPIVFLQDDSYAGISQDHLKIWTVDVDWVTPVNSTISAAQTINTAAFTSVFDNGNFSNLGQPGGGLIDAIQGTIMNQAQFRKFANHNSAVFNFVVDVDGTANKRAGIRWYELRQTADGQPWTLYQEGTYTAPDNKHAWMASLAMDGQGNIGMGYTGMGGTNNQVVSSYYTGRYANDPLNTMNISETEISLGTANIVGNRYGDYSKIDVDPADDTTFWFINEINKSGTKNVVGVFKLELSVNDTGVASIDAPLVGAILTANEQITVTIVNLGSAEQTNIPVSYTINGNVVNEVFAGPIAAGTTAQYTFAATADMSNDIVYTVEACTNLVNDENNTNNCSTVILNQLIVCQPVSNTGDNSTEVGCNLDGIKHFVLGTIDVDDGGNGCNTEGDSSIKGYADRRNLSTDLNVQVGTYVLQAQMNWAGGAPALEQLSVWIDFNDDGTFENSEQLISGGTFAVANELVDFDLIIPPGSMLGSHTLRIRCLDTSGNPGNVNDPCADYEFGETQDYTVNIINQVLNLDENLFDEASFIVSTLANNQFTISVSTVDITERLNFSVTNMIGQKLLSYNLDNVNSSYNYDLDMSYATPGVYILRLGNSKLGNVKKIIVK